MLNVAAIPRDKCPLCRKDGITSVDSTLLSHGHKAASIIIKCDRCGDSSITWEALEEVDQIGAYVAISGIAREWTELKRPLEINKDNLQSFINLAPKSLKDKKRKLLQSLLMGYPKINQHCYVVLGRDYPLAYVGSSDELMFILNQLCIRTSC